MIISQIVVNTSETEVVWDAKGQTIDEAIQAISESYPDWTSMMIIITR